MTESSLWPLVLYFVSVLIVVGAILVISALLGERSKMTGATIEPFESGVVHIGSAQIPITVEFYLTYTEGITHYALYDIPTIIYQGTT